MRKLLAAPAVPTFTLPNGTTVRLRQDLTVVTDGDLTIAGDIAIDFGSGPSQPVNLTLASRQGSVTITQEGSIGAGAARPGTDSIDATGAARAGHGMHGGFVRLLAPMGSVVVQGAINTASGGRGGIAIETSLNLDAGAQGGSGGAGGDILISALEEIRIDEELHRPRRRRRRGGRSRGRGGCGKGCWR